MYMYMCTCLCVTSIVEHVCLYVCVYFHCLVQLSPSHQRILWFMAILDSIEVVFEVFMEQLMREPGKYCAVIITQCIK